MLLAYLKRQYKLLLLLVGAICVFAAVFVLYDLPLEAVAYAGMLCLVLGLILFAIGYSRFLRRHRELQQLLRQTSEKVLPLPPAHRLLEEDYQLLLQAVCQDRARLAAGLHILAAFPMLCRILELFGLYDVGLFALCTAGALTVFAAVYALVYGLTARTYERIVGGVM